MTSSPRAKNGGRGVTGTTAMQRGGRCSTAKSGEGVRVTQSEKQWMKRLVYFLTAWRSMVKAELRWRGDGNGGAGAADPVALWRGGCCFFVHGQTRKRERGDSRGAVTGSGPHLKRLGSRASRPRREVDHCGGCCLERAQERDARRWRTWLTRGTERAAAEARDNAAAAVAGAWR